MATRLGKEAVDQHNVEFNTMFTEICLPYYEKIAEYKKDDLSDDRGKSYFSETPDKNQSQYGNSFLRLILESIEAWAKIYTCKSDQVTISPFFLAYARLVVKRVKFPEVFKYYKQEEVDKNTSATFKTHSKNIAQVLEESKLPKPVQQIQQQDPQFRQNQQPIQTEKVQKPPYTPGSGPVSEIQREINQSAQLLINQYSQLKAELTEKALSLGFKATSQYIKDLKEVNQSLFLLKEKIDNKVEELLSQDDEDSSLELLNVQDEIKILYQYYQKLQKEELTPQQYKNKFEVYKQQAPRQQKGHLQSIYEETENSQSSMQFGKVDKKFAPNTNIDSLGLQYNPEQIMHDFQIQLSGITEQHEREKLRIQQEHQQEVSSLKKQIQESNQIRNMLDNQVQEFKKKENRYKEIEQQYIDSQKQKNNSSQSSSDDVKRINTTLTDQIKALKLQNEQMQSQKEKDRNDIDKMRIHIAELKEENEFYKDEIKNLKQQLNTEKNQGNQRLQQLEESHKQEIRQLQEQMKFSPYLDNHNLDKTPSREISDLQKRLENEKSRSANLIQDVSHKSEQIKILEQELKAKQLELEQSKAEQNVQNTALNIQIQQKHQAEIQNYKQQYLSLETSKKIEENSYKEKLNLLEQKLKIQFSENENLRNETQFLKNKVQELNQHLQFEKTQQKTEQIQIEPQQPLLNNKLDLSKIKESGFEYVQVQSPQSISSKQNYSQVVNTANQNKLERPQSNVPYSGYLNFQNLQIEFVDNVKNLFIRTQQIKVPVQNEMIYPYLTAEEYYQKKIRPHKGIVLQCKRTIPSMIINQQNLQLYKMYHLNRVNNTIFVDNSELKIAVIKQIQKVGSQFYINYGIYFKTDVQSLNLKAYMKNLMNFETLWTSQQEIQQNLQRKQQLLLEVSIKLQQSEISEVPILEVNYNNKIQQVLLPLQILSLIQYRKISKIGYQRKWKTAKIYRSEVFEYNTLILSNHLDITRLNECFSITNPEKLDSYAQGLDEIKYFAQFQLQFYNLEGIIKFELMPNQKMIIFVGLENSKQSAQIQRLISVFQEIFT
ncbi:unnamed protein product (macronuclear) [Paramecium tetraurelia]|uniref:Uncharacterized protein n=1 Tax=Paramecium tetraurelia TaxID=5888 RepID=A0DIN4_PARTE|nr:uncharacterized protein GSPATT00017258001 [Paramecium tetraurelia]CAK82901.1 unnamed protein product [Paramecium tetraurelia]|eukprot:XP_001450298.1 hypothetical protein (macronuclear) [Paramecium tetraurelia strain d4-2]